MTPGLLPTGTGSPYAYRYVAPTRRDLHRQKMAHKKGYQRGGVGPAHPHHYLGTPRANIGRNHPDYGMSPSDHDAEKQLRGVGNRPAY